MRLENIVWDARDPRRLGAFWASALAADPMTDQPDLFEARVSLEAGFFLDLCFPQVAAPSAFPPRLHLDVAGGAQQREVVERLLALGAQHGDIGQGDVAWEVLTDVEGNAFCVLDDREIYRAARPIAALPMDSAEPERDAAFWADITGWVPFAGAAPATLRHPTGSGPLLEFLPEPEPKEGKSRIHLDVRRDSADGDVLGRMVDSGARVLDDYGPDLPWTVLADPSGNEFCVLPPPAE